MEQMFGMKLAIYVAKQESLCPLDLNTAFGLLCCTHYPAVLFLSVLYSQGQTRVS